MLLIAVNVIVFVFVQPQGSIDEDVAFTFEYAAIPCEIVEGQPLTEAELVVAQQGANAGCGIDRDVEFVARDGRGVARADVEVFPDKNVWLAVVVSTFLHGSWLHLGGNMLFLWVFGNNIEDHLGAFRYLAFYLVAGVVATVAHVAVQLGSTIPLVGASGAVAGVMGAYLIWFPLASIWTLIGLFPLPLPAFMVLGFWFVGQFFIGPDAGVAWMAHVGGFVFGAAVALAVRESVMMRRRMWTHGYRVAGPWDNRSGPRGRY